MIRRDDLEPMPCLCGAGRPLEVGALTLNGFWVECPECGNETHGDTEDEARQGWNLEVRAALARRAAA